MSIVAYRGLSTHDRFRSIRVFGKLPRNRHPPKLLGDWQVDYCRLPVQVQTSRLPNSSGAAVSRDFLFQALFEGARLDVGVSAFTFAPNSACAPRLACRLSSRCELGPFPIFWELVIPFGELRGNDASLY
jgi:hypothetical protein